MSKDKPGSVRLTTGVKNSGVNSGNPPELTPSIAKTNTKIQKNADDVVQKKNQMVGKYGLDGYQQLDTSGQWNAGDIGKALQNYPAKLYKSTPADERFQILTQFAKNEKLAGKVMFDSSTIDYLTQKMGEVEAAEFEKYMLEAISGLPAYEQQIILSKMPHINQKRLEFIKTKGEMQTRIALMQIKPASSWTMDDWVLKYLIDKGDINLEDYKEAVFITPTGRGTPVQQADKGLFNIFRMTSFERKATKAPSTAQANIIRGVSTASDFASVRPSSASSFNTLMSGLTGRNE